MPPVPNNPEPLEQLQARYSKALEHVYDPVSIRDHAAIRPGECAANVFDFEDGLRLLISRERILEDSRIVLHFSASFPSECRIADEMRLLAITMSKNRLVEKWAASIPQRFRELSGDTREIVFAGWSQGMTPHWCIEEPQD